MTDCPTLGVILLGFGGPDSLEAVEPFMTNIIGRKPVPALVQRITERYKLIGGRSPLVETSRAQAAGIEEFLRSRGVKCRALVGMLHWRPYIREAVGELAAAGINQVVGVSLSPYYSRVSTGAYAKALEQAASDIVHGAAEQGKALNLQVKMAPDWYNHPLFLEALADQVSAGLAEFPAGQRSGIRVIFSAHSLPVDQIRQGDPYVEELMATVKAVAEKVGLTDWQAAYQSKGGGQGEWLGPEVEELLDQAAAEGKRDILLVPAGFVSDHIETLYDIDIAIRDHARSLNINFHRTKSLNTTPKFIAALAEIALQEFDQKR